MNAKECAESDVRNFTGQSDEKAATAG